MRGNKVRLMEARKAITGQEMSMTEIESDERLWGLDVLLEITRDGGGTNPDIVILRAVSFKDTDIYREQRRLNRAGCKRTLFPTRIQDPNELEETRIMTAHSTSV